LRTPSEKPKGLVCFALPSKDKTFHSQKTNIAFLLSPEAGIHMLSERPFSSSWTFNRHKARLSRALSLYGPFSTCTAFD
jgi:hypothetical protein